MSSSSTSDAMRVSDEDRDRVAEMLRDAVGRGQLTVTEVDERLAAAYGAVTRRDLAAVIADLPQAVVPAPAPAPVAVAAAPAPAARKAEWRPWLGGALLMIGIWAMTSLIAGHALFFWPAFPIGFWALGLAFGGKHHHHHRRHHIAHRS
jgi:hypothetical protein